ncbi:hypothetical protein [Candidatus Contubernalis alkaliaceticus]|uniref:hypothetical protein n=1 Tax=Candidatus Contubernalis alkaliaceticus TaxID=338645 RepID=UPI001F4C1476|nr:hypothetical protein [Candidatus Contubernalis alkalaceticus]UNC90877.1 hypothetical protein HUE98_01515 [Candidatus Contubernalis alkalaceticus]
MLFDNTASEIIQQMLGELPKETVIGEFSGRDSVAAIIKAFEDSGIGHILPVASFAGTEYGEVDTLKENHLYLKERIIEIYGKGKILYPLVFYSSPDLWSVINGRFASLIIEKFGFYTPCIGCHAYFHILRVPMALKLGAKIISGERESHDQKIKINQLPLCLSFYKKILAEFEVELLLPLRNIQRGKEIEKLIGWEWKEGKNHPECSYSGNYRDLYGHAIYEERKIKQFLENFLGPVLRKVTQLYIENQEISRSELIKEVEKII